jgi:hypothetical protein
MFRVELMNAESAAWPGPEYHDRPAGGIYEPVLRTRCAKSSCYKGPSLASPFPLWSLHACPSLVPLSICDWVRAEQLPWLVSVPNRTPWNPTHP